MNLVPAHFRERRLLLKAGVALPTALCVPRGVATAAPTPSCDHDSPTREQTAGPFYTPDSPLKSDFRPDDPGGKSMSLTTEVLDLGCRPVSGAVVDLWHADSKGDYDNRGFRLRGHQVVDDAGVARFRTIRPARYGWRTPHIHARIFSFDRRRLLTTQLYFPDATANEKDGLFRPELLLEVLPSPRELSTRFVFFVAIS